MKYTAVSLLIHVILLLMLTMISSAKLLKPAAGENETALASYLVNSSPVKPALHKPSSIKLTKPVPAARAQLKGEKQQPPSALIALLHEAIQRAQEYPASAAAAEQEGRATVEFTLNKSGELQQLKLLHSSGIESLDQAALAAVNHAAPFYNAQKYLQESGQYQIDVVFAL